MNSRYMAMNNSIVYTMEHLWMAKIRSDFLLTNDALYIALTSKLWGVFWEFLKAKMTTIYRESIYRK